MSEIDYTKYHRDVDYEKFESLFRNIFTKRFNIIKKILGAKKGKVLDIGCSTGVFLDLFKERGWETWGVEPSNSAESARRKGHNILKIYFEEADFPLGYFDLVIMNHTLEHMENPLTVLEKINKISKKGGMLFVDVPNAGGVSAKVLGKYWPYRLPKEHKHQFTRDSLTKILNRAGFKVVHFESRSGLFEFANPFLELWESLTTLKKRFLFDVVTFPYSLTVSLSCGGDSMSIVCTKNQ